MTATNTRRETQPCVLKTVYTSDHSDVQKYSGIILVLFFISISALVISFYSLVKVQEATNQVNLLKNLLKDVDYPEKDETQQTFGIPRFVSLEQKFDQSGEMLLNNIFKSHLEEKPSDESAEPTPVSQIWTGTFGEGVSSKFKRSVEKHENITVKSVQKNTPKRSNQSEIIASTSISVEKKALSKGHKKTARIFVKKSIDSSGEQFDSKTSYEDFTEKPKIRHYHKGNQLETLDEYSPKVAKVKSVAALHLNGDTSKYVFGQHSNYNGNGHLRHPQRTFVDWKLSEWAESGGMKSHFTINEGIITVKETGLYLVYAQIFYLDPHDTNGYRIYKNSETLFQCTTTTKSETSVLKSNTCYTGGVTYLIEGENVSVTDLSEGRYSLFEPGKSFYGIVKLGDFKVK